MNQQPHSSLDFTDHASHRRQHQQHQQHQQRHQRQARGARLPLLATLLCAALSSLASHSAQAQAAAQSAAQAAAQAGAQPAGAAPAGRQDLLLLKQSVEQFLQVQTAGLPGEVSVKIGAIDAHMTLAACPAPQAFLMPGARAWGKTTVGVRCAAPSNWTVYIQAQVSVSADYIAAAMPLAQGQPIEANQLVAVKGDLTTLPAGIATDMQQVIGRSVNNSLPAGTPLRLDTLRSKPVVLQGQLVRVVSSGNGFSVASEGRAILNAGEGQVVQVRTASGQQVSGVARAGGLVEVTF